MARSIAASPSLPFAAKPSPRRTIREKASMTRNCPGRLGTATSRRQLFVPRSSAAKTGSSCSAARRGAEPACCGGGTGEAARGTEGTTSAGCSPFGLATGGVVAASRANTLRPRRRLRRFLDFGLSCRAASVACPFPDKFSARRSEAWSANGLRLPWEVKSRAPPAPGACAPVSGSSTFCFPSGAARTGTDAASAWFVVDFTVTGQPAITKPPILRKTAGSGSGPEIRQSWRQCGLGVSSAMLRFSRILKPDPPDC